MSIEQGPPTSDLVEGLARYPLLDALLQRRSRRFGKGMHLNGGPLAYASRAPSEPLSLAEEAALAFAGAGITGHTLAELPYQAGDLPEAASGNIVAQLVGRTAASADAIHAVTLFVINDEGTWLLRRPQDFAPAELDQLIRQARDHRLTEAYEQSRIRIAARRVDVPREIPFVPAFNKWSANRPGSTYFQPVSELTALQINILLTAFEPDFGYFLLDERDRFRPAGLRPFARSRGGHLQDDPAAGRVGTIGAMEAWLLEFAAIEQGGILQNLGLMAQALGLGGFPHFAAHPLSWPQALGFRMTPLPFSRLIGAGWFMRTLLGALGRDRPIPSAVGLERDGEILIKPFCPPYYRNMEEAVLAFVDWKYAEDRGTLREGGAPSCWRDGSAVRSAIPRCSDRAIAATVAYCDHVHRRYGRFPAVSGPFRTILAYQAHRLDLDFYEKFYKPEALSETQRARR